MAGTYKARRKIWSMLIPDIDSFGNNFTFIWDVDLRNNIISRFVYVVTLLQLKDSFWTEFSSAILVNLYRDIAIQTASIVETILYYAIKEKSIHWSKKVKEKIKSKARKYTTRENWDPKICRKHPDKDDVEYVAGLRKIHWEWIKDKIQFKDMINLSWDIGLLDEKLMKKADYIRSIRNEIHIHVIADEYIIDEDEIKKVFDYTTSILGEIEKKM